jgi:hypothetical protein
VTSFHAAVNDITPSMTVGDWLALLKGHHISLGNVLFGMECRRNMVCSVTKLISEAVSGHQGLTALTTGVTECHDIDRPYSCLCWFAIQIFVCIQC